MMHDTTVNKKKASYKPKLPTAAKATMSHTMIAARKRISSTITNAITTMYTATHNSTLVLVTGK